MLGAILDNLFAQNRQNDAQAFSAQQYATRYQTQTEDMKKAGINPMLSVSSGAGSQPTSTAASPGSNFTQSQLNSAQIANINADTENKDAQRKLLEAQASQATASAAQSTANLSQIDATVEKIKADTAHVKGNTNYEVQQDILEQTAYHLSQLAYQARQQGMTTAMQRQVIQQTVKKLINENIISEKDIDAMNKTGNLGRLARELQPASDIAGDWLNPSKWFTNKSKSTSILKKGKP